MMKLARVYRAQANFADEAKLLEEIQNIDIEKLLDRARLQAK